MVEIDDQYQDEPNIGRYRGEFGIFHTDRNVQLLMESAMQETIDVAKAAGVDLRDDDIPNWYPTLNSLGADKKTSMLQDIESERKTEVQ